MPDLNGVDLVPMASFICFQKEVDTCSGRSLALCIGHPCLAVMAALGMGAQVQMRYDFVSCHAVRLVLCTVEATPYAVFAGVSALLECARKDLTIHRIIAPASASAAKMPITSPATSDAAEILAANVKPTPT